MAMSKAEREKYFNPDGSIKKTLQVVEVLPDGTRVFENGAKAKPSMVDYGGDRGLVRLDSMTEAERDKWEKGLMERVGRGMSEYYQARATGAFEYSK